MSRGNDIFPKSPVSVHGKVWGPIPAVSKVYDFVFPVCHSI